MSWGGKREAIKFPGWKRVTKTERYRFGKRNDRMLTIITQSERGRTAIMAEIDGVHCHNDNVDAVIAKAHFAGSHTVYEARDKD